MPALQQVYRAGVQLRFIEPALNSLNSDLKNLKSTSSYKQNNKEFFSLKKEIKLSHIYYNYPNASRTALEDINLSIPVKSTVGLVGSTGSGKTTTVDIILGLLEAHKGS